MVYKRRYSRVPVRRKRFGFRKKYINNRRNNFTKGSRVLTKSVIPTRIVADKTIVKLTYSDSVSLDLNLGNTYFNLSGKGANGFAGGNLQDDYPAGLQNWARFYSKYRILSSGINVIFSNTTTNSNTVVGVFPMRQSTNPIAVTPENATDQPFSKWYVLGSIDGNGIRRIKHYMTTKKMMGQRVTTDDSFQGTLSWSAAGQTGNLVDTTPTSKWSWIFYAANLFSTPTNISVAYTVTYYVSFEDRVVQESLPQPD